MFQIETVVSGLLYWATGLNNSLKIARTKEGEVKTLFILCSTVSSGLNSLAAVTLEDYVRPLLLPNMSDAKATKISKGLSITYGFMAYGLVYLMANLSHLVEVTSCSLFR